MTCRGEKAPASQSRMIRRRHEPSSGERLAPAGRWEQANSRGMEGEKAAADAGGAKKKKKKKRK